MVRKGINMRIFLSLFCVLLLVGGVSGVKMKNVTLSVMKGDTVTLKPDDVVIPTNEQILWKFEGSIIVNVNNLKDGVFATFDVPDTGLKEKLLLDTQTGSLTITNITTDNTGFYQLVIRSSTVICKNYSVTVHDEMNTVSVKEGDTVTLRTGLIEIKGYDLILWTSEDHLMAEIRKATNLFSLYKSAKGKFEGRLQPERQTGSLIISDSRTTDSGDYHLHMSNSAYTLQRTIRVTVKSSGVSPGAVAGIVVAVVILVAAAVVAAVVTYYRNKISKLQSRRGN